jgi:hypothetical protein
MQTKYLMIVIAIPLPIPNLPNCSTAQQLVRTASALGEAIGTGMGEACMKRDQFKRLIVMIRREREYLTKAFLSCRFSLHESLCMKARRNSSSPASAV